MNKKSIIILVVVVVLIISAVVFFALKKKKPSVSAENIKNQYPADSPDKLLVYLKENLSPAQVAVFGNRLQMVKADQANFGKWDKAANDTSKALKIPEEVALYYHILWDMNQTEDIENDAWNQIKADTFFMYAEGFTAIA